MSGRLVGSWLDNAPEDLTTAELLVGLALAEDARDTDRRARFSDVKSLTHRTRLAPGTIRNALSELGKRGLIVAEVSNVHRGDQEYTVTKLQPHLAGRSNVSSASDTGESPTNDSLSCG